MRRWKGRRGEEDGGEDVGERGREAVVLGVEVRRCRRRTRTKGEKKEKKRMMMMRRKRGRWRREGMRRAMEI